MALRVYVLASGLQQRRRHGHRIKLSFEVLKTDQNGGGRSGRIKAGWRPCIHSAKPMINGGS